LNNVKIAIAEFMKDKLFSFNDVQKKISKIELNSVVTVYIFLQQILYETRLHKEFTEKFKKAFDDGSTHVQAELSGICSTGAEGEWERIKDQVEKRIQKRIQKLDTNPELVYIETSGTKTLKNPPNSSGIAAIGTGGKQPVYKHAESIASLPESVLRRKVMEGLDEMAKSLLNRGLSVHLKTTYTVLKFVKSKLEKGQDDGLKFTEISDKQ